MSWTGDALEGIALHVCLRWQQRKVAHWGKQKTCWCKAGQWGARVRGLQGGASNIVHMLRLHIGQGGDTLQGLRRHQNSIAACYLLTRINSEKSPPTKARTKATASRLCSALPVLLCPA